MNAALGLSPLDYGRGAGIFFLGYFLFEVPSNLALARVGARIWIARIAIVWGFGVDGDDVRGRTAQLQRGPLSARRRRSGFLPWDRFHFTYWFPARERARAMAQFATASMAAGIVGAPLSGSCCCHSAARPAWADGSGCFSSKDSRRSRSVSSRSSISTMGPSARAGCRTMSASGWWTRSGVNDPAPEGAYARTIRAGLLTPGVW